MLVSIEKSKLFMTRGYRKIRKRWRSIRAWWHSEKDTLLSVLYSWLGAFAPILITWLIISIADRGFHLTDFFRNGDFFIIADGLVLPSLLLLVKNRQLEASGTSTALLIGIVLIILSSAAFGTVKLLAIINVPNLKPNMPLVNRLSIILTGISMIYALMLQRVDDKRIAKLADRKQAAEEEKISKTVHSVQEATAAGTRKLEQSFEQLRQNDN